MKVIRNVNWIDLFCGLGGTSAGIHLSKKGKVIGCVNHDKNAIAAHKLNHKHAKHFIEDIRDPKVIQKLFKLVDKVKKSDPNAIICIWASLECTNFSRAKGGQPKNPDSRSLAEHMYMYLDGLKPDYFFVENVKEFMEWGPLDENGNPIKEQKGEQYNEWISQIKDFGFEYEYRVLNSANYGSYQSRERLFIQFAKHGLPIDWPEATHAKKPTNGLKKWKAVKDVLDLNDEGTSIFGRKKPLVTATLQRIYAGLIKEVAGGKQAFLNQYNGGKDRILSIDNPINTIPTNNRFALFKAVFLAKYYGAGDNVQSVDLPSPTLTTKDRISTIWIDRQYKSITINSINEPIGTILTIPKANLIHCKSFILNPSHGGHTTSIHNASPTVIARQDKAPLYLINTKDGEIPAFGAYDFFLPEDIDFIKHGIGEKSIRVKIVEFMFIYGISDIKQRMLKISELLPIQGFPVNYHLVGSQAVRKKGIGNAVEVNMAKALVTAHFNAINEYHTLKNAG